MKISIFPNAIPFPQSKDEKRFESSKCLEAEVITIKSEIDLYDAVTQNAWSPSIFSGSRSIESFLEANFIALDIDMGLTINEAEKRCEKANLEALIAPTVSHSDSLHKFRIIFPLLKAIKTQEAFDCTWKKLQELFPELDTQCSDSSRFFFACQDSEEAVYIEGDLLEVIEPKIIFDQTNNYKGLYTSTQDFEDKEILEVLYGQVPKRIPDVVNYFLNNAHTGLPGEWNTTLNSCVFTLALQKVKKDAILHVVEKLAPDSLDKTDITTFNRAYKHGTEKREDL